MQYLLSNLMQAVKQLTSVPHLHFYVTSHVFLLQNELPIYQVSDHAALIARREIQCSCSMYMDSRSIQTDDFEYVRV